MSGILALINKDGAPVHSEQLRALAATMADFAPDGADFWASGNVGLAHSFLRVGRSFEFNQQPFSRDGEVCIVSETRIDARSDLIRELEPVSPGDLDAAPDAELILHAYAKWDEDCVQHLLGDFAFAIWNARRQCLFCARDHFGVRPLYYCDLDRVLLVSNSIWALRAHPAVSDKLNELAIADFLLFEQNQDPNTTTFADIRRVPPAHTLKAERGRTTVRPYWTLPVYPLRAPARTEEVLQEYRTIVGAAVEDRMRGTDAALQLSGGMDSSTLAVFAAEIAARTSSRVRAFTIGCEECDSEAQYAHRIAKQLGIQHQLVTPTFELFAGFATECRTPEPLHNPSLSAVFAFFREVARTSRVMLVGYGPDVLLRFPFQAQLFADLRSGRVVAALADTIAYLRLHRRIPPLQLNQRVARLRSDRLPVSDFPAWLHPEFDARLRLRERWADISNRKVEGPDNARAQAYAMTRLPLWTRAFEAEHGSWTRLPLECAYPFFDLRVVRFLLSLPRVPWCINKHVMRAAMQGRLPEEILKRPKTPMRQHPAEIGLQRNLWALGVGECAVENQFVRSYARPNAGDKNTDGWRDLRPVSLALWLRAAEGVRYTHASSAR